MRILFTSYPAIGHFHPLAPLGLAARDAGHDVRVAIGPNLTEWVDRCGLDAYPVGVSAAEAFATARKRFPAEEWAAHMFTEVWVETALPGLRQLAETWPPDLVIHEEMDFAGLLLGRILDVPTVTHSWPSPARSIEDWEFLAELLAPLWESQLRDGFASTTGDMYLDACPPPFQSDDIDAIPNVVAVRPVLFDGPSAKPPSWLTKLARPVAYVTLGTVPAFSTPELLLTVVEALEPFLGSVVVTTGPNEVSALGELPPSVHATPYLPQSLVLPHVDLVVSHAGAGSTFGALTNGLPHLALPQGASSQVAVAERVHSLGAGLKLDAGEQTLEAMRAAARRLLDDGAFARRAKQLCAELEQSPTPAEILTLLEERYGGDHVPTASRS